ncbi:hypothetical protein Cantr_06584 [Candida viswanathii]|uniref:Uncharacterized protein n=1 Tax=Candida viswanathii TaxID=5486 RepID=A0A367XVD7_9ASCO|nr:hypothetical protein Cantr_06584 [Candida viswanathii]
MAPKNNRWKYGLITGAVIIGASYLVVRTFPHIFSKQEEDDENEVIERTVEGEGADNSQSNKPIELFESEEAFKKE